MSGAERGIELERASRCLFAERPMLGAVLRIIELSAGTQAGFQDPRQCEIRIERERLLDLFDGKQYLGACLAPSASGGRQIQIIGSQ